MNSGAVAVGGTITNQLEGASIPLPQAVQPKFEKVNKGTAEKILNNSNINNSINIHQLKIETNNAEDLLQQIKDRQQIQAG